MRGRDELTTDDVAWPFTQRGRRWAHVLGLSHERHGDVSTLRVDMTPEMLAPELLAASRRSLTVLFIDRAALPALEARGVGELVVGSVVDVDDLTPEEHHALSSDDAIDLELRRQVEARLEGTWHHLTGPSAEVLDVLSEIDADDGLVLLDGDEPLPHDEARVLAAELIVRAGEGFIVDRPRHGLHVSAIRGMATVDTRTPGLVEGVIAAALMHFCAAVLLGEPSLSELIRGIGHPPPARASVTVARPVSGVVAPVVEALVAAESVRGFARFGRRSRGGDVIVELWREDRSDRRWPGRCLVALRYDRERRAWSVAEA